MNTCAHMQQARTLAPLQSRRHAKAEKIRGQSSPRWPPGPPCMHSTALNNTCVHKHPSLPPSIVPGTRATVATTTPPSPGTLSTGASHPRHCPLQCPATSPASCSQGAPAALWAAVWKLHCPLARCAHPPPRPPRSSAPRARRSWALRAQPCFCVPERTGNRESVQTHPQRHDSRLFVAASRSSGGGEPPGLCCPAWSL
jgi:hypothetical protein